MPTTLPTLDELIGVDGLNEYNVADHVLRLSTDGRDHVYTLHAELEGGQLAPVFDRLLQGWKAAGLHCTSMRGYADSLNLASLPHHAVSLGSIAGRSGTLALQGAAV